MPVSMGHRMSAKFEERVNQKPHPGYVCPASARCDAVAWIGGSGGCAESVLRHWSGSVQHLAHTARLDSVRQAEFDAVFYPGGHGPMWDMPNNRASITLLESFLAADKPVELVCHAPAALLHVKTSDGARPTLAPLGRSP